MAPKFILTIWLFLAGVLLAAGAAAQSGRNKPNDPPAPTPTPRRIVYAPTEKKIPAPPTPAPTQKKQIDDDVIKVESNLVPIPVSVTDARGEAVGDLRLEDFALQIDGRPATIGELARSETPVRLALLFDNSTSVSIAREFEKKAAVRFFRRVIRPDKDLAALFSVSTATELVQPLTKNVDQLTDAIENFPPPEGATALLDGIVEAAEYLRDAPGRRVMVIVSDGDDTVSGIDTTLEKVVKTLLDGNCQVYVVKTTDFENFKRTGRRGGNANLRQLTAERRMQEIAAQTGGAVYSPIDEDELGRAFSQISAELAGQYILSYYPEDEESSRGAFRNIALSLTARKDVTLRTRKGYYVPKRN